MRNIANRIFVFALGIAFLFAGVAAGAATPMIAAGGTQSAFLHSDGSVWSTGGSRFYSPGATSPVRTLQLSGVIAVETCANAEFALLADGTLWGRGANDFGQLADGTTQDRLEPQRIPGLSDVRALAAGVAAHVLALKNDGTVWAWGRNGDGQLGDGTRTDRLTPVQALGLTAITRIAVGTSESIALKSDGTVWVWGFTSGGAGNGVQPSNPEDPENVHVIPTQVANLDQVIAIAAGASHFMALRADGTVWTWGRDGTGENGLGTFLGPPRPVQIPGLDQVVAIEAKGELSSHALKADGTVWAWGSNYFGQLGVNGIAYSTVPIQVPGVGDVTAISTGRGHVLALRRDGTVYAWGWNANGQLGDGTLQDRSTPRLVVGPGGGGQLNLIQPVPASFNQLPRAEISVSISSGRAPLTVQVSAVNASDADGTVSAYYWKTGDGQQATGPVATFTFSDAGIISIDLLVEDSAGGRGAVRQDVTISPALRPAVRATPKVLMGSDGSIALANDGRVLTWGKNQQIGLYDPANWTSRTLAAVNSIPIANDITGAVDIGGGYSQVFALLADGTVLGWGSSPDGQVGTASANETIQAQRLLNLPPVRAVAAGGRHSLALTRDGRVFAWGGNYSGELGLGDNQNRFQPTEIAGWSNVVAIAAGYGFSAALIADGNVWAWGDNQSGQIGDGTTISRNRPVQVTGLTGINRIFAIGYALFAQKANGSTWAIGYVPLDSPFDTAGPGARHVPALDNVVQVVGGGNHNMIVLKADGTVWTGGKRSSLALGLAGIGDHGTLTQLPGINDAIQVTSGSSGAMVLRRDGTVLAWGYNGFGSVGDGTLALQQTPVLVLNETADGFLDLIPEVPNVAYTGAAQRFFSKVVSDNSIVDARPTITNTIKFNAPDVGKSGAVFVTAIVPPGSLVTAQSPLGVSRPSALRASKASSLTSSALTVANPFVLIQLTPSGWQQVVNGQLIPYASGVLGDQLAAQTILNNTDTTNLKGAQFCVGYGTSAAEMTAAGRMRAVATIPDPNATSPSTVSCILQRTASDFNGDYKSDILWRNGNGQVAIWTMNGMTMNSGAIIAAVSTDWTISGTGDLNGDGRADILWRDSNGQVAIWLMNGMEQSSGAVIATVGTDWTIAGTGDFDGDGKADILWRNSNGQVAIWLMNGMAMSSGAIIAAVGNEWRIAASGDFDGDGKADILWRNSNGQVAIWLMNGMALNSGAIIAAVSTDWTISGIGDVNGDGKADILWRNINGEAAIWLMNGMAQQSAGSLGMVSTDWMSAGTGDFDGDGKADILWRNSSGQVAIWLIDGVAQKSSALLGLVSTDWRIVRGAAN